MINKVRSKSGAVTGRLQPHDMDCILTSRNFLNHFLPLLLTTTKDKALNSTLAPIVSKTSNPKLCSSPDKHENHSKNSVRVGRTGMLKSNRLGHNQQTLIALRRHIFPIITTFKGLA